MISDFKSGINRTFDPGIKVQPLRTDEDFDKLPDGMPPEIKAFLRRTQADLVDVQKELDEKETGIEVDILTRGGDNQ